MFIYTFEVYLMGGHLLRFEIPVDKSDELEAWDHLRSNRDYLRLTKGKVISQEQLVRIQPIVAKVSNVVKFNVGDTQ